MTDETTSLVERESLAAPEPDESFIPRSEMKVRLALKEGGGEIECLIMPTLMWIKIEVQRLSRRETVLANKWNGQIERMKKLVGDYEKLVAEGSPEAEAKATEIDGFQIELDKTNEALGDIRIRKTKIVVHYPALNGKQLTEADINWIGCDEKEIEKAQSFFLS